MNRKLRFSWGHIIAFIAMIFCMYVTFMGTTYLTGGNMTAGVLAAIGVTALLVIFFIVPQVLKGSDNGPKFGRNVRLERVLIFASPVVLIVCMYPMGHFWTVQAANDELTRAFGDAVNSSRAMFTDYEEYAGCRIDRYDMLLRRVAVQGETASLYRSLGFVKGYEGVQVANRLKVMELALMSDNYKKLKAQAYKWIDMADNGVSAWNVFLLGNTREIASAITDWNSQLNGFSEHVFRGEAGAVPFGEASPSKAEALGGVARVEEMMVSGGSLSLNAVLFALLMYAMLVLPYLLQRRDSKSPYTLFGRRAWARNAGVPDPVLAGRQGQPQWQGASQQTWQNPQSPQGWQQPQWQNPGQPQWQNPPEQHYPPQEQGWQQPGNPAPPVAPRTGRSKNDSDFSAF